jgi:transposase
MTKALTKSEVARRMTELRNLQQLHRHDREQISDYAKALRIADAENTELKQIVATLQIQVAELQTMVFGKKKRPPGGTAILVVPPVVAKQVRSKASYRRPLPPAVAITTEVAVPLPETCTCGGSFDQSKTTTHERFVQDIPLPALTPDYQAQLVTKYLVERGICSACGKPTSSQELGGAVVSLGPNVRLLVTHLIAAGGMSYAQVASLLLALYDLHVTDGEVANILHKQHQDWQPAYQQLKADIRASPVVHADETSWPLQQLQGAGYAWVLADAASPRVCYELAQSRGAATAKSLFGQDTDHPFTGIRITDDYGAYRNPQLPGTQQLCWAHLYRTIRDLRYNDNLPEDQLLFVSWWYEQFADIYQDLRTYLSQPYDTATREQQSEALWQRLRTLASTQPDAKASEPQKLTKLKAQLLRADQNRLLICLPANTPCDNNRAERDLRQLVLKRKRSFGSKSEKGAQALATVLSLCTTTWRSNPTGYFKQLALLG